MLPRARRLRSSADYSTVVRQGRRASARSVVVHASRPAEGGSRAGFVVSRAVGNAVTRNRVKRRLSSLVADRLPFWGEPTALVVRAKPSAATASFAELGADLDESLRRVSSPRSKR